jgi:hypothetical protein
LGRDDAGGSCTARVCAGASPGTSVTLEGVA